ncbi:MAG: O-antigen polysaccharide polymerase Wzy family protein [Coriobacteriales bacterium]|nr:O-antigen polysaccharide polymerase Wzy family protein [Coriobacteriales bacterium]
MGIARAFHVLMLPLSCLVFATGLLYRDLNILFGGMLLLFVVNVVYACANLRSRLFFLIFHGGLALFLVSRPTLGVLYYHHPLTWFSISFDGAVFSLSILFLSMLCLRLGASFIEWRRGLKDGLKAESTGSASDTALDTRNDPRLPTLRIASGIVFLIGFVFVMWFNLRQWELMQGLSYEQYYLQDFSAGTTLLQRTLATMEPYALCAFLAAFPSKRLSLAALLLHLLTTIPQLLIGSRGAFVIAAIFIMLYYVLREYTDGRGTWIGRIEKGVTIIAIPLGILGLGLMNYIRANTQAYGLSIMDLLVDALYKQGVTYTVFSRAYQVHGQIEMLGFKGYSFGGFTDYILYGPIGTNLWGITDIYTGNNIQLAVQGHSFAHANAYYAHWNYLGGEGFGSSYLLELYQDFGYTGVAVFSLIFGALLNAMQMIFQKGWFKGTLVLISATFLFHMPRGAADEWIEYIWTPQFWFTLVLIILCAAILRCKVFQGFEKMPPKRRLPMLPMLSKLSLGVADALRLTIQSGALVFGAGHATRQDASFSFSAQSERTFQTRKAIGSDHENSDSLRSAWHHTAPTPAHSYHNGALRWFSGRSEPLAAGTGHSSELHR